MPKLIIEIDEDLKRRIKMRAVEDNTTIKEMVTRILKSYLKQGTQMELYRDNRP